MKRARAAVGTAVLACVVGLAPAMSATAATVTTLPNKATWVNDTVRVVWSTPADGIDGWPASDVFVNVQVDGKKVDEQDDVVVRNRVVEVSRAAGAGPAHVEVILNACVDGTEGYDCTPHTLYDVTVSRRVVERKAGQVSAETLLGKLEVAAESHASSYKRTRFTAWIDANKDGENTRAEVLKAESKKKVVESRKHTVVKGLWVSPYDGRRFTDASKLAIDHLVPLQEAWTSGAFAWSAKKRTAYANDIGYTPSLVAVSKQESRSKGNTAADGWLPDKVGSRCSYVRNSIAVKYRWGLKVDAAEKAVLKADLAEYCVNVNVTKPGKPNIAALVGTPKPKPTHPGGGGTGHAVDVRYATCTELLKHPNHAPYQQGRDVEYGWYQDRDHDGLVCE